jgi:uncharacterized membrane protein YfcA
MDSFLDSALGASALSCVVRFLVFVILGGVVGWLLAGPIRWRHWPASLAVIGICGAWLGAEFAHLFGQAEMGSEQTLLAALLGSVGLAYVWRRHHPEPPDDDGRIAGGGLSA